MILGTGSDVGIKGVQRLLLSQQMRPVRFISTGAAAAVFQLGLLALLTRSGWNDILANSVAFLLAAQVNFLLSSLFTWHDRQTGSARLSWRRWIAFHGATAGSALCNMGVFLLARMLLPVIIASAVSNVVTGFINFAVGDRLLFRRPTREATESPGVSQIMQDGPLKENSMLIHEVTGQNDAVPQTVPVYSIIAPVYNEKETLPHFYERVKQVMETMSEPFEIIFVNDGSQDGSYQVLRELHKSDPRVRTIDFSRNFGHQIAISAGLDYARGSAIIIIDSDLQDPPEVIPEMIARWKVGAEVVYAQRRKRQGESRFKLLSAALFYRLIVRITSVKIPLDTGDFRLLDRRVVDTLRTMREHHRFMRGLSAWVGFRQESVLYERHERFAGETKYPLHKMIRFSMDAITSFSHVPLQLATTFGFVLAGLSLLGIVIAAILRIFTDAIVGQASTLILVLFLGGIQLIFLGIIGEYLGRIYDEVRARPLYIVREVLGEQAHEA